MATAQGSQVSEPTFRLMRGEDLDQVFELIQVAFGEEWPKLAIGVSAREHLEWKISAPELGADPPEIVEIDGRIVGYIGGSASAKKRMLVVPLTYRADAVRRAAR